MKLSTRLSLLAIAAALFASVDMYSQTGPGGVGSSSNNVVWLDASTIGLSNGSLVNNWGDISGNGNNFTGNSPDEPTYNTTGPNGLPSVEFDGISQYLESGSIGALDTPNLTWITVSQADNTNHRGRIINSNYSSGAGAPSSLMCGTQIWDNGNFYQWLFNTSGSREQKGTSASTSPVILTTTTTSSSIYGYKNSANHGYKSGFTFNPTGHNHTRLGMNSATTNKNYDGSISEVIMYSQRLTAIERIIVENYISSKYGISIANDHYAYDGTYPHELIGIGFLNQDEHLTSRGTGILTLSSDPIGSKAFLFIGHDNAAIDTNQTDIPSTIDTRQDRVWAADLTNSVGDVSLSFDLSSGGDFSTNNGTDYVLLIDDDGDFSNGGTTIQQSGVTYDGVNQTLTFTGVNITSDSYISYATLSNDATVESVQSGNWHDDATWSCGCVPTSSDNVKINSGHTVTVYSQSATNEGKNITIASGGNVVINSQRVLRVHESLRVEGDLNSDITGKLEFFSQNTSAPDHQFDYLQSDTLDLGILIVNTFNQLIVDSGTFGLRNALVMIDGDMHKNSQSEFIFHSNNNQTAAIRTVASGSSISGSTYVLQRFIAAADRGGNADWGNLASPVQSTTIQDWDERPNGNTEIIMSGVGGVDGNAGSWNSVYTYDAGNQSYTAVTSTSKTISPGEGIELWLEDSSGTSSWSDWVFDSRGTPTHGDINLDSRLSSGNGTWQLLGNVYQSWFKWASTSKTGLKDAVWIYQADAGGYVQHSSGNTPIPPSQGFWVEATTGSPTLTMQESAKSNGSSSTFYKQAPNQDELIAKLQAFSTGYYKEAHIKFDAKSDLKYEPLTDASLLRSPNELAPFMYTETNDDRGVMVNAFNPDFAGEKVVLPLVMEIGKDDEYRLTFKGSDAAYDHYQYTYLEDKETGEVHEINDNTELIYQFVKGTYNDRFAIIFTDEKIENSATGHTELSAADKNIRIYESDRIIYTKVNAAYNIDNIRVYNIMGQEVESILSPENNTVHTIPMKDKDAGVYIVKVTNKEGLTHTKKVNLR